MTTLANALKTMQIDLNLGPEAPGVLALEYPFDVHKCVLQLSSGKPVDQAAFFRDHPKCELRGPTYLLYPMDHGVVNIRADGTLFFYNFPSADAAANAATQLVHQLEPYYTSSEVVATTAKHPLEETKDTVQPPAPKKKKLTRQRRYENDLYHLASIISTKIDWAANPNGNDIQVWASNALVTAAWLRKEHGDVIPPEALKTAIERAKRTISFHEHMAL